MANWCQQVQSPGDTYIHGHHVIAIHAYSSMLPVHVYRYYSSMRNFEIFFCSS